MSNYRFRVGINPKEALKLVSERTNADLVHEELHNLGDEKYIGILVFEKYYMRVSNRAALVVIIDNIKGYTDVRTISTGSSQGMFLNFDWGAADDFASSIESILKDYIQD